LVAAADASKLKAVHNVSFDIKKGECFGLVGESGCGKTTTGRCIIRLYDITSGSIYFKGYRISGGTRWNEKEIKYDKIRAKRKIADLKEKEKEIGISGGSNDEESEEQIASEREAIHKEIEEVKSNLHKNVEFQKKKIKQIEYDNHHVDPKLMSKMQMIFQDPIDSLDPRMTVEEIIGEGLKIQGMHDKKKIHEIVCDSLDKVGLIPDYCSRYPHEFSGGQRQRIGIARALVMNPEFLICDEPISALDVSIRAQIINLLNDLKDSMNLTLMFIAHDLSVVKYFCDQNRGYVLW
jgi:oligopeptide transport system ATP-binding protein